MPIGGVVPVELEDRELRNQDFNCVGFVRVCRGDGRRPEERPEGYKNGWEGCRYVKIRTAKRKRRPIMFCETELVFRTGLADVEWDVWEFTADGHC